MVTNAGGVIISSNALLTVLPAPVNGSLTSSLNPSLPGQSVSFTVTITAQPPGAGIATGNIQLKFDGTNAGPPILLNGGSAVFTTTTLDHGSHLIASEYAGDPNFAGTTNLLPTGQLINTPPVAGPDTIVTDPTNTLKFSIASLMDNDSDADLDPVFFVEVSGTSANGGTVIDNGRWIFYTAPPGITNKDTFTYTISDHLSAPVTGTVTINFRANYFAARLAINSVSKGSYLIQGAGDPGRQYRIEFFDASEGTNWQVLGTATADASGMFQLIDSTPAPQRFYRSVFP